MTTLPQLLMKVSREYSKIWDCTFKEWQKNPHFLSQFAYLFLWWPAFLWTSTISFIHHFLIKWTWLTSLIISRLTPVCRLLKEEDVAAIIGPFTSAQIKSCSYIAGQVSNKWIYQTISSLHMHIPGFQFSVFIAMAPRLRISIFDYDWDSFRQNAKHHLIFSIPKTSHSRITLPHNIGI